MGLGIGGLHKEDEMDKPWLTASRPDPAVALSEADILDNEHPSTSTSSRLAPLFDWDSSQTAERSGFIWQQESALVRPTSTPS